MIQLPPIHIIQQEIAKMPDAPQNPCLGCEFWSPSCDIYSCKIFQEYKEKVTAFWKENFQK